MNEQDRNIEERTLESTFCFIDIAGYTALTDVHGAHSAADLVQEFGALVNSNVEGHGQVHELIGDCAFIVYPNPVAAIQSCAAIYRKVGQLREFPVLRTGLHHGSALFKNGRYFGTTINLAARVAAQAKGGEVLATGAVVELLRDHHVDEIEIIHIGHVTLKNIPKATDLYTLRLSNVMHEYVIDPVCQMQVDKWQAIGSIRHQEQTYWFCSLECVQRFTNCPDDYLQR